MSARRNVKASASATALGFPEVLAAPSQARIATSVAGDSASQDALQRLDAAVADLKRVAVEPMLRQAVACMRDEDPKTASEWAIKALQTDERSGMGWYLLAIAREKVGDFKSSVQAYESALALLPDHASIANDLGRLAYRLNMKDVAEKLFHHFIEANPTSYEAANNLASVVRDQNRYEEAIEIIRPAIEANPEQPLLWNTLGTILSEQGSAEMALTFFDEALRLEPGFAKARYNRGNARLFVGMLDEALEDNELALSQTVAIDEQQMMTLARSTIKIALGRIGEGWDDYEARLSPHYAEATRFLVDRPMWTPQDNVEGKSLVIMGEQGLGDEVLFANLIPDVIEEAGPTGKVSIAVEKRLVPLFQRSFPTAHIVPHATYRVEGRHLRAAPAITDWPKVDLWAPMASLLRKYRRAVIDFPMKERFLIADPDRVAYWKNVLAAAPSGPKVGILWKSLKLDGARKRYFSPFEQWAPVLTTPGVTFVNLQYGESAAEIVQAKQELGIDIWTPPGINLKDDLDDVAALTCALDLTIGFANATTNIAAACGAPTWMISVPGAWTRLGTEEMPWYPATRIFLPRDFGVWDPVMADVAIALATKFPA